MQLSAEARLFWNNEPSGLTAWFCDESNHSCTCGGGSTARQDTYLFDPKQIELGVKLRGERRTLEIKGLVANGHGKLDLDGTATPVEMWGKWSSDELVIDARKTFATQKLRWLRKFSTVEDLPCEICLKPDEQPLSGELPRLGCNIELTRIVDPFGRAWWSLGFESFGSLTSIETSLLQTAAVFLGRPNRPILSGGVPASYPMWIVKHGSR